MELLIEIQMDMTIRGIRPEEFEGRVFMSMFNYIGWSQSKANSQECFSNSQKGRDYAKDFGSDIGLFSVLVMKENGMERMSMNLKESGTAS